MKERQAIPPGEQELLPVTFGTEAYTCLEYAREEREKLWSKVWLQAGRLEDLPEPGNYITFNVEG